MRYLVEIGKPKGAGGGLSKLKAKEALIVARQLRGFGHQDVHIVDANSGAPVPEAELERLLEVKKITRWSNNRKMLY
jgi:hypothetical protein